MAEDVKIKFDADSSALIRELKKTQGEVDKLKDKLEKTGSASKKTAVEGKESFITLGNAASLLTVSFAGALKIVQALNEESRKAGESLKSVSSSMIQLGQLSGGDPGKYGRLKMEALRSMAEQGLPEAQAKSLQETLEYTGQQKYRARYAGLHYMLGGKSAEFAQAVSSIQKTMGAEETGTPEQLINKLLSLPQKDTTEFAKSVGGVADFAKELGISDEELMVAIDTLSRESGDVAGSEAQIKKLFNLMYEKGLKGKPLGFGLGLMGAQIFEKKDEDVVKYFGSKDTRMAFRQLYENRMEIDKQSATLEKKGAVKTGEESFLNLADLAVKQRNIAAGRLKMAEAESPLATQELNLQAAIDRGKARALESGQGALLRLFNDYVVWALKSGPSALLHTPSPEALENIAAGNWSAFGKTHEQVSLDKIAKSNEEMNAREKSPKKIMSRNHPGNEN